MDILKTLKTKAEQVEVVNLQNEKTTVEYEANQLKTCTIAETKGTAVPLVSVMLQVFNWLASYSTVVFSLCKSATSTCSDCFISSARISIFASH